MALQRIKIRNVANDERARLQHTSLDGIRYRFKFAYNASADSWFMDIRDATDTVMVAGIRLVLGVDLLEPYKYMSGMPQGQLFCYDTSLAETEPGLTDFDSRVVLLYRPAAEVVS